MPQVRQKGAYYEVLKKDWVKKDEKNEDQASVDEKSKKKPKIQHQHAKTAQELDLDSNDSKGDKSVALA